jgi:hypothetical protein
MAAPAAGRRRSKASETGRKAAGGGGSLMASMYQRFLPPETLITPALENDKTAPVKFRVGWDH